MLRKLRCKEHRGADYDSVHQPECSLIGVLAGGGLTVEISEADESIDHRVVNTMRKVERVQHLFDLLQQGVGGFDRRDGRHVRDHGDVRMERWRERKGADDCCAWWGDRGCFLREQVEIDAFGRCRLECVPLGGCRVIARSMPACLAPRNDLRRSA